MIIDKSAYKWIMDNMYSKSYLERYGQYPIGIRFHLGIVDNHEEMKMAYESDNEFYEDINSLAPFGSGNNEPKFMIENLKVINSNVVANNHIKSILLGKDGTIIKAFTWNAVNTPLESVLNKENKKLFHVTGKLRLNEWKGNKNIDFLIEDLSVC